MKLLVDAHLPPRLCAILASHGHDVVHTKDLPAGNATKDRFINSVSVDEQRIVVSKDRDFFYSHMLQNRPWKLLLITTGNIRVVELCELIERNLAAIEVLLQTHTLVEVDRVSITPVR